YDDDLQFAAGQVITVTDIEDDEWYSGTYGGKSGLFPKNFVETLALSGSGDVDHEVKNDDSTGVSSAANVPPVPPIPTAPADSESSDSETEYADPSELEPQTQAVPPSVPPSVPVETSSSVDTQDEIKQSEHDLVIDDLIRRNSTALPDPLDESASVFEGNMKHVEESVPSQQDFSSQASVSAKQPEISPIPSQAPSKQAHAPPTPEADRVRLNEAPPPVPRVPMPGSLPKQRDDPYAIKKQFIGAGKSSYVPQVKPRDNSHIAHGFNDVSEDHEIVRETDEVRPAESNEPKMSLKERIALLQKRQQEEAEREAAALKKKEERKKRLEDEKKKLEEEKKSKIAETVQPLENTSHTVQNDEDRVMEAPDQAVLETEIAGPSIPQQNSGSSSQSVPPRPGSYQDSDLEGTHDPNNPSDQDSGDETDKGGNAETQPEPVANEDGDDEDDDEDLRRRRLVERMAKISGGRNMFGMMGMPSPFGGAPASATSSKSRKKSIDTASSQAPKESETVASPKEKASKVGIPMPGIAPQVEEPVTDSNKNEIDLPAELPKASAYVGDEEGEISEDAPGDKPTKMRLGVNEAIVREREDKSVPESLAQTQDSAVPPLGSASQDDEPVTHNMNIVDENFLEPSNAGYDADADISDRGLLSHTEQPSIETSAESGRAAIGSDAAPLVPPRSVVAAPPRVPDATPTVAIPTSTDPHSTQKPLVPAIDTVISSSHPPAPTEDAPMSPAFQRHSTESFGSVPPPLPTEHVPIPTQAEHTKESVESSYPGSNIPPPLTPSKPPSSSKGPPPPIPQNYPAPALSGEIDDSSSDETSLVETQPKLSTIKANTFSHQVPDLSESVPSVSIKKSATGSFKRNSMEASRKSGEVRRSGSFKGRASEQDQAALVSPSVEAELADLTQSSSWWIKSEIPESLSSKLGVDLEFEVDENRLEKRNGREVIYKDYYILFHDLSQISFDLQYQSDDPRDTVSIGTFKTMGSPKFRKDTLHAYSSSLGHNIAGFAEKSIGSKLGSGVVEEAIHKLAAANFNVLKPIGEKAFGAMVYKNFNHNITKVDDIRPGDIICMRNTKFTSHKGLGGLGTKNVSAGEGTEIYSAVVVEYDSKKDKVKVAENGKGGIVKKESYKFAELKSGRIKVYRVLPRDSVGW
ncbi:hypothetical protein OXX79_005770, partial [Metschnikowia pulcherrima]